MLLIVQPKKYLSPIPLHRKFTRCHLAKKIHRKTCITWMDKIFGLNYCWKSYVLPREQRNHGLKYEEWIVEGFVRDCFVEFLSSTPQSNKNILSVSEKVFILTVSNVKIANLQVGTIYRNVRIALQFSYQFAIFISVCNFYISLRFSSFGVQFLHWHLQFSYEFAIFIWVCNFHINLQFSPHDSCTYLHCFAWILSLWPRTH